MNDNKIFNMINSFDNKKLIKFAEDDALLWSRYLIYTRKGKEVSFYCTHCNSSYTIVPDVKIKHNDGYVCKMCSSKCIAKSEGTSRGQLIDKAYFMTWRKAPYRDAVICLGAVAVRDYSYDYKYVETKIEPAAFYYFGLKDCRMWKHNYWTYYDHMIGNETKTNWSKRSSIFTLAGNCGLSWIGNLSAYEDKASFDNAINKTSLKYGLELIDKYKHSWLDTIFPLYQYCKHPEIEYVYKIGFEGLTSRYIQNEGLDGAINWRGKTITKMLRLTKQDLFNLGQYKKDITTREMRAYQALKLKGKKIDMEDFQLALMCIGYDTRKIVKIYKYLSLTKFINYISKQVLNKIYEDESNATSDLYDYYCECEFLEYDMKIDRILRPKDLRKAHLQTSKLTVKGENKKADKKIAERLESLYEKYQYENEKYIIIPAQASRDLIIESNYLGHCVHSYVSRYARGSTDILLVRKKEEKDNPFYTMEYRDDKLVQCRGKGNKSHTVNKDLTKFINEFIAYIETSNQETKGQKVA